MMIFYIMIVLRRSAVVPSALSMVCWGVNVKTRSTSATFAAKMDKMVNAGQQKTSRT